MYLGRVRQGEWISVSHPKQRVGTAAVMQGRRLLRPAGTLDRLEQPIGDVPDWSDGSYTIEADGTYTPVRDIDSSHLPYIQGYYDPTVTLISSEGEVVFSEKSMHLLDSRISPVLFTVDIFIDSDVPVGNCFLVTSYNSTHVSWIRGSKHTYPLTHIRYPGETRWTTGRVSNSHGRGTWANLHHLEVLPSGNPKGTYLNSYLYEKPQANFLLGQYDSDTLDFRKNPRE